MKIVIRDGHIIDPSQGIDGVGDIFIEDGKIKEIACRKQAHESHSKGEKGQE